MLVCEMISANKLKETENAEEGSGEEEALRCRLPQEGGEEGLHQHRCGRVGAARSGS